MKRKILIIIALCLLISGGTTYYFVNEWLTKERVKPEVKIEVGASSVDIKNFLLDSTETAVFIGNLSSIDLNKLGEYVLRIKAGPSVYDTKLVVSDTIAPNLEVQEKNVGIDTVLEPGDFVVRVDDHTDVTLSYESAPDFTRIGTQSVSILATDAAGNQTRKETTLHIANLISELTIELGSKTELKLQDFLIGEDEGVVLLTDLALIPMDMIGEYTVEVKFFENPTQIPVSIVDTVKPTAVAVPLKGYLNTKFAAADFVTEVTDFSPYKVYFKEVPNLNKIGEQPVHIGIKDAAGNIAEITSYLTLQKDEFGPVISGLRNYTLSSSNPINWLNGVSAYDKADGRTKVAVDASKINLNAEGSYALIYSSSDRDGNVTKEQVTVTVKYVKPYEPRGDAGSVALNDLADGILSKIINGEMSNSTIISKVYSWVDRNISYSSPASSNYLTGATTGLRMRRGNCYTIAFSTVALLRRAGVVANYHKEYEGRHCWAVVGNYIVDARANVYMKSESSMQNYVWGGFYLYRQTYSEPPQSTLVLKTEYDDYKNYPFSTIYELNPDVTTSYPDKVVKTAGVAGQTRDQWDRAYMNGVRYPARDKMIEDDQVVTEKVDQIILVGRRISTTAPIPAPKGTGIQDSYQADGTRIGGADGIQTTVHLVTSVDPMTGVVAGQALESTTTIKTAVPYDYVIFVASKVISQVEMEITPAAPTDENTTDASLDGTYKVYPVNGVMMTTETETFKMGVREVTKTDSVMTAPIVGVIYKYVAPQTTEPPVTEPPTSEPPTIEPPTTEPTTP